MQDNGLLVTGFGPFLDFGDNPSQKLAESSGCRHEILEVSFKAVDEFVVGLDPDSFDTWLAIGLASKAETMLVETVGHNKIGATPDVRGEVHGPGKIDPVAPPMLAATLWPAALLSETDIRRPSTDPGGYLCNFLLFRALQQFPEKRVGFLHIPSFEMVPFETQIEELRFILEEIGSGIAV